MGERKQPYKYLSKVYIYPGFFSALLYFSGKTITRLNRGYHYKHLCKVHISNGNFNLGRNVHEAVYNASAAAQSAFLSALSEQCCEDLWKSMWEKPRPWLLFYFIQNDLLLIQLNTSFLKLLENTEEMKRNQFFQVTERTAQNICFQKWFEKYHPGVTLYCQIHNILILSLTHTNSLL